MRKRILVVAALALVGVGFIAIPADPTSPVRLTTVYDSKAAEEAEKNRDPRTWGNPFDLDRKVVYEERKSGLWRAIEGRLRWLGIV